MIDVALSGVLSGLLPSRPAFGGYDTPGHHKSYKRVTIITSTKDKRSEEPAAVQEVIEMFYFNGDEVQAPVLTKNERELVRKLKDEWFGDGNNCDMISTDYEDSISTLGYTIAEEIEWGNRRSLGGVIASLRKKHVIAVTKGARPKVQTNIVNGLRIESIVRSEPCTELWFDCDALEELLGE